MFSQPENFRFTVGSVINPAFFLFSWETTVTRHFQKISGYKVISKCRNCGKRLVGKSETLYCDDCLERLRSWREKQHEKKQK